MPPASRVSIHAPAWGATGSGLGLGAGMRRFNPRTRVGCDVAPAPSDHVEIAFQSTHPRGVRLILGMCLIGFSGFQSTHPRGVRRGAHRRDIAVHGFQSTHPRGVRPTAPDFFTTSASVSIHAPAWGATPTSIKKTVTSSVSIHAPAWGATQPQAHHLRHQACFNPRTRVGCDCFHVLSSRFP